MLNSLNEVFEPVPGTILPEQPGGPAVVQPDRWSGPRTRSCPPHTRSCFGRSSGQGGHFDRIRERWVLIIFLCHCRGNNALYKTGLILQFTCQKWCLKFATSPGDVLNQLFWPQNGPRYRSCHLRGQKSLGPLEKSRFCARDHLESLKWPHLVISKGWFPNAPPNLQHRVINSYYQLCFNDGTQLINGTAAWDWFLTIPILSRMEIYILE